MLGSKEAIRDSGHGPALGSWVEIMSKRTTFSRCFLYMLFDFWRFLELRSCFCTLPTFYFILFVWANAPCPFIVALQTSVTVRIFYSKSWLAQPLNFGIMKLIVEISLSTALVTGLFSSIHLRSPFIFMHPMGPTKDYSRVCAWEHVFYYIYTFTFHFIIAFLQFTALGSAQWLVLFYISAGLKGPSRYSSSQSLMGKLGRTHPDLFCFRMSQETNISPSWLAGVSSRVILISTREVPTSMWFEFWQTPIDNSSIIMNSGTHSLASTNNRKIYIWPTYNFHYDK